MSEHQGSGKWNSNFCVLKRITHLRWLSLSQDYDDYDYHLNRSQTSNIRQYLTNLTCVYNCVYNCIHVSQRASQVAHHPPKTAGVSISSWVSQTASAGRPTKPGWSLGRCPTDGTWWDPWRVWEGFSLLKFLCLNMCGRSGRWLSDYILIYSDYLGKWGSEGEIRWDKYGHWVLQNYPTCGAGNKTWESMHDQYQQCHYSPKMLVMIGIGMTVVCDFLHGPWSAAMMTWTTKKEQGLAQNHESLLTWRWPVINIVERKPG